MVRRLSSVDHLNQLCEGCLLENMLKIDFQKKQVQEQIYIYIYILELLESTIDKPIL